jgi:antitoxin component YwqK of YwqJK toxin-antitoxin module
VWWHGNDQKWWERHYKDGELDGLLTRWDENGKVESETRWKDGVEVEE